MPVIVFQVVCLFMAVLVILAGASDSKPVNRGLNFLCGFVLLELLIYTIIRGG